MIDQILRHDGLLKSIIEGVTEGQTERGKPRSKKIHNKFSTIWN